MSAAELAASLARIGQVQAHLSAPISVLIAIGAISAAVSKGLWLVTRHVTVMAHEGAHATVASAIGRKIDGIEFRLNANGVTHHSGSPDALGLFAVSFVGYLGPSLFGIGAAALISGGHIVAVLWIGLAGLVAIMLTLRKSFGIVTVILAFVLLFLIAGFASVGVQVITAYVIAWFLLVSGIRGIRVRRAGSGDSEKLHGMTKIPHSFWYRVWLLCSAAALVFGATLLV
jgi:Peptidase M50B-like